ncbi:hypothetical protein Tco_1202396 [Tanacetum coccineum]
MQNSASTSSENGATLSFTNEQIMKLMNLINDVPFGNMQANMAIFVESADLSSLIKLFDVLPSSVLNGKSSFEFVYGLKPKLSHLRSFGCLCCSSVLDNSDKSPPNFFVSRGITLKLYYGCITFLLKGINVPSLRFLFINLSDFDLENGSQYGLEKYVSYANLTTSNYRLSTTLNKYSEPNTYYEAIKNTKCIGAMNNEIEALNRNNTWTKCVLLKGKDITCLEHEQWPDSHVKWEGERELPGTIGYYVGI